MPRALTAPDDSDACETIHSIHTACILRQRKADSAVCHLAPPGPNGASVLCGAAAAVERPSSCFCSTHLRLQILRLLVAFLRPACRPRCTRLQPALPTSSVLTTTLGELVATPRIPRLPLPSRASPPPFPSSPPTIGAALTRTSFSSESRGMTSTSSRTISDGSMANVLKDPRATQCARAHPGEHATVAPDRRTPATRTPLRAAHWRPTAALPTEPSNTVARVARVTPLQKTTKCQIREVRPSPCAPPRLAPPRTGAARRSRPAPSSLAPRPHPPFGCTSSCLAGAFLREGAVAALTHSIWYSM